MHGHSDLFATPQDTLNSFLKKHSLVFIPLVPLLGAQVLNFLQSGSHPDAVLSAYGEFYAELAVSNHASWQDLLLDEVGMVTWKGS